MDVNQATSIASVHQDAKKTPQQRDPEEQDGGKDEQNQSASGSWREADAVEVDVSLIEGVTPEVQAIIDSLNRRIEPLRAELELAKGREAYFCELASRHSFLDVPCRREFMRELTHILTHTDHLTVPPAVIVMHLVGAEAVRTKAGRLALDHVLGEVVNIFTSLLQPADILGNLGGSDFGIILLSADETSASGVANRLRNGVSSHKFLWAGQTFHLDMVSGIRQLTMGTSVDAILDAADQDLRKRLAT